MKLRNQDFYWGLVTNTEPSYASAPPKGTFIGGPSGTSQAPHLYLSEGKANARCYPAAKVVKVKVLTADEYEKIERQLEWLQCLENAGVDNWSGYDFAIQEFNGDSDE